MTKKLFRFPFLAWFCLYAQTTSNAGNSRSGFKADPKNHGTPAIGVQGSAIRESQIAGVYPNSKAASRSDLPAPRAIAVGNNNKKATVLPELGASNKPNKTFNQNSPDQAGAHCTHARLRARIPQRSLLFLILLRGPLSHTPRL